MHGRRERVQGLGTRMLRVGECGILGTPLPFSRRLGASSPPR